MRLDALSGLAALLLSTPALLQLSAGRLDVSEAAIRVIVVLIACAVVGTVLQSIVDTYREAVDADSAAEQKSPEAA